MDGWTSTDHRSYHQFWDGSGQGRREVWCAFDRIVCLNEVQVVARVYNIVGGECLMLNIPCINPLQIKPVYYSKT